MQWKGQYKAGLREGNCLQVETAQTCACVRDRKKHINKSKQESER